MRKHRLLIILLNVILLGCIIFVVACNLIIVHTTDNVCYSSIDNIPHSQYGILFGTGRSANSSPYYDARVNATIALLQAGKVDTIVISGENLYADYNEVDSMARDIRNVIPTAPIYLDYEGVDTYHTLNNFAQQFGNDKDIVLISQYFHNQRSVYYAQQMFNGKVLVFNAVDTNKFFWYVRNVIREWGARTKAVVYQQFNS